MVHAVRWRLSCVHVVRMCGPVIELETGWPMSRLGAVLLRLVARFTSAGCFTFLSLFRGPDQALGPRMPIALTLLLFLALAVLLSQVELLVRVSILSGEVF